MNENPNHTGPPLDQPGYWQFYSQEGAESVWEQRQLEAGNKLIRLGLGGLVVLLTIWGSFDGGY